MAFPEVDAASVLNVIRQASPGYGWVVLDFGPLNPFTRDVLLSVDEILIATTPALTALYETKRMINVLDQSGVNRNRVGVVAIRAGDAESPFPEGFRNQVFGLPMRAILPDASKELRDACLEGRLPGANTKFRQEVARLARNLAGLPNPPRGRLRRLLFGGHSEPDLAPIPRT